jgi:hypothetical protein
MTEGAGPATRPAGAPLAGRALRKVYREEDGSELTILDGVDIEVRAR